MTGVSGTTGSLCEVAQGDAPGAGPWVADRGDSVHIENGKNACCMT